MYIVLEIQKTGENISTLVDSFVDINLAKSKYHQVLAAAAVSQVEQHGAAFLDDKGTVNISEYYEHPAVVSEESE